MLGFCFLEPSTGSSWGAVVAAYNQTNAMTLPKQFYTFVQDINVMFFMSLPEPRMQPPLLSSSSFSSSSWIWLLRRTDPQCPSHPRTPSITENRHSSYLKFRILSSGVLAAVIPMAETS